jgi:glutathione S-transferase
LPREIFAPLGVFEEKHMKLYFSPGACSFSPHIVLRELGLPFDLVQVDLKTKKLADGSDFKAVHPKAYVPILQLDDGRVITEGPAIVQYLADLKPESRLAPANGTFERTQLQSWLNFVSTELHKSFSPLFNADGVGEKAVEFFKAKLHSRLGTIVEPVLAKSDYLTGSDFTVADAYLYVMLTWAKGFKFDFGQWPAIARFFDRVATRPAVIAAHEAEAQAKKKAA